MSCWGSQPLIESAAVCEDATCNLSAKCVWPPHDQMMSTDKEFCFMATDNLMMELQRDSIKPDESEQKVVKSVMWLLEDKNADLAVRR